MGRIFYPIDINLFLSASCKIEHPIGVYQSFVTRLEPAVSCECFCCGCFVVKVFLEYYRASHFEIATLVSLSIPPILRLNSNSHLDPGYTRSQSGEFKSTFHIVMWTIPIVYSASASFCHAKAGCQYVRGCSVGTQYLGYSKGGLHRVGLSTRGNTAKAAQVDISEIFLLSLECQSKPCKEEVRRKTSAHAVSVDQLQKQWRISNHVCGLNVNLIHSRWTACRCISSILATWSRPIQLRNV